MDKKRSIYLVLGFSALLVLVMLLLAWGGRRQSLGIVLPESQNDSAGMDGEGGESRLNTIAITPETVRPAISTLSRPASYSRSQTVETFWSGGSGQSLSQIYVSGSRTRLDTQLTGGSTRHMVLETEPDGATLAGVWYDDDPDWRVMRSPFLTADVAGRMLSYETVRDLPVETIAMADYRERDGVSCVYVETVEDGAGYVARYWVSVENGLLHEAERLWMGEVVYRFTAGTPEIAAQEESLFLLPDGGTLSAAE
ncbi:MAG: hypothetical protein K2N78_11880 [Oscillospiraceae bacterium]|nr:hypothetical protein [Oscillospiraceae bacterium]